MKRPSPVLMYDANGNEICGDFNRGKKEGRHVKQKVQPHSSEKSIISGEDQDNVEQKRKVERPDRNKIGPEPCPLNTLCLPVPVLYKCCIRNGNTQEQKNPVQMILRF